MSAENENDHDRTISRQLEAELGQHTEATKVSLASQIRGYATGLVQLGYPKEGYPINPVMVAGITWLDGEEPRLKVAFEQDGFNPSATHRARVTVSTVRQIEENEACEVGREYILAYSGGKYLPNMSHSRDILPSTNEPQVKTDSLNLTAAWLAVQASLEMTNADGSEDIVEIHTFPELDMYDMVAAHELLRIAFKVHRSKDYPK